MQFKSLIITLTLLIGGGIMAAESEKQTIHVSASGKISLPATRINLVVGVRVENQSAAKVQQELDKQNNLLMSYLKGQNVDHLQTQSYQIQKKYSYMNGKQKDDGFEGNALVSFQIGTGKVGSILDNLIKNGANEIRSIQFTATKSELEAAHQKALDLASQNALRDGKNVLSGLDLKFKKIQKIIVGQPSFEPRMQSKLAFSTMAESGPSIEGGEVETEAVVNLVLSYE